MTVVPAMSIVVCTYDNFQTVARLMDHLNVQEGRELCELIIVCPSESTLDLVAAKCDGFASLRILEFGPISCRGPALAAALRVAAAPVVAFTEDHSFPEPGWAMALMQAHEGPWAAVSATLVNANPNSPMSWSDLLIGHGTIVAPSISGERLRLGGHNVSYKKDILIEQFGELLDDVLLDTEPIHQEILVQRGFKLFLSAEARVRHNNFETFRGWIPSQYHHGRMYGAVRWRYWNAMQRTKFLMGAPLSIIIRILRMMRQGRVPGSEYRRVAGLLPYMFIGIGTNLVGEIMGCFYGVGKSADALTTYEFKRYRFYGLKYHRSNTDYED